MAPNVVDSGFNVDPEGNAKESKSVNGTLVLEANNKENITYKTFRASLNLLAHILIGFICAISIIFGVYLYGLSKRLTQIMLHIVFCVVGYQLLMSEAILALCPYNGWSSHLRLVDKKRAHTILQLLGSFLAIAGSIVKITDKTAYFTTRHGIAALVAMIFTVLSLINGLTSLYAYELRKCIPGTFSKVSHILFGVVAYVAAAISLIFAFDKTFFYDWAFAWSYAFVYIFMGLIGLLTVICIITPVLNFFEKSARACKE